MHKAVTAIRIVVLALVVGLAPCVMVALVGRAGQAVALASLGRPVRQLTITSPPDRAVLPSDGPAPVFRWRDTTGRVDAWRITIALSDGAEPFRTTVHRTQWQPTRAQWAEISRRCRDRRAVVVIRGFRGSDSEQTVACGSMSLSVSGPGDGDVTVLR